MTNRFDCVSWLLYCDRFALPLAMEGAPSGNGMSSVEMSLDDIIKSRKKANPPKKKKPAPKKPAVKAQKRAPKKAAATNPGVQAQSVDKGQTPPAAGGIGKKRSRARKGAAASAAAGAPVGPRPNDARSPHAAPASANRAGALNSKRGAEKAAANAAASKAGCRIAVSNLNEDVSSEDIKELFGAVGPLVSSQLLKNADGRSARRAEVIFVHMAHALEAIKRYNDVPLDDMPLKITLATERSTAPGPRGPSGPSSRSHRGGRKSFTPFPRARGPAPAAYRS